MVDRKRSTHDVEVTIDVTVDVEANFSEYDFVVVSSVGELKTGDVLVNVPTCEVHRVTAIRTDEDEVPIIVLDGTLDAPFPIVQRVLSWAVKKKEIDDG